MSNGRRTGTHRRALVILVLLVPVFSGCLAPDERVPLHEGPLRAFDAVYEGEMGEVRRIEVALMPKQVLDPTAQAQSAYSLDLRWEGKGRHGDPVDNKEVLYYDGELRLVRRDAWSVSWTISGIPPFGILWPVLIDERPEDHDFGSVVHGEEGFRIEKRSHVYHYQRGEPVPFLIERADGQGSLHRVEHREGGKLQGIATWSLPQNATGERELLFPGADEPWFTHPVSYEEQFEGLMEHSESVRTMIESGGCVDQIVHDPPKRHDRNVLQQPAGEGVVIHRTEFSVLAAPSGSSGGDPARFVEASLSPGPRVEGERWLVTWARDPLYQDPVSQEPLLEDSVEYEQVADGYVGYMECDEIQELGRAASLRDAWERAESLPVDWDLDRLQFTWKAGLSYYGVDRPERYRFEMLDVPEEGRPEREVDLRMDAQSGAFIELSADAEVLARLDE